MSTSRNPHRRHAGLSLIELIMFIVIVSVGIVGILSVLNVTVKSSADPLISKQMLVIAEALLEEVQMMPFTYCDPNDRNVANASVASLDGTATDATKCWDYVEDMGPDTIPTLIPTLQARTSSTNPFNNVNDYYVLTTGYVLNSPIPDLTGTGIAASSGFSAKIEILAEALNGIPSAESLRIVVTVNHGSTVAAGGDSIAVEGYRTRHSPNFVP